MNFLFVHICCFIVFMIFINISSQSLRQSALFVTRRVVFVNVVNVVGYFVLYSLSLFIY